MTNVHTSVWIDRPVEEVFAFVVDPEKVPDWAGPVLEAEKTSPGAVGLGTKSSRRTKLLGRTIESDYEITAFEPNQVYANQTTSGPVDIKARISFAEDNGGTEVKFEGNIEAEGFFKIAEPMLARVAGRQLETDAQTLKDLLEAK